VVSFFLFLSYFTALSCLTGLAWHGIVETNVSQDTFGVRTRQDNNGRRIATIVPWYEKRGSYC
jgi:hypothetical protein